MRSLLVLVSLICFAQPPGGMRRGGPSNPQQPQQQPAPPPAPVYKPEELCSVAGQVTSMNGEPLRKAEVTLRKMERPGGTYVATSGAGGNFVINNIEPGKYRLSADRNGFVPQSYTPGSAAQTGATLTLEKGQHLKNIDFKLTPQGVIAGRVLDEDGEAMRGVTVQAMQYRWNRGAKQLAAVDNDSTNDLGE